MKSRELETKLRLLTLQLENWKKLHDLITYGLPALPPIPETYEALQEVWDNLGPPPEILYDKLPQER